MANLFRKSRKKYQDSPDSSRVIDFDEIDKVMQEKCAPGEKTHSIDLEHEIVNLGFWLHYNHPKYFNGSWRASKRYLVWILHALTLNIFQIYLNGIYMEFSIKQYLEFKVLHENVRSKGLS